MNDVISGLLAIAVLASMLLIGAGLVILVRRTDAPKRGWLMLAAGIVTLLNVWLYATLPPQV